MKKWLYNKIFPGLAYLFIQALSSTFRIKIFDAVGLDKLRETKQQVVYAFWHGRQFVLVKSWSKDNLVIMSSTSRDGKLQAKILSKFGYQIVFGSSSKSPVRALMGAVQKMRQGNSCAFAVDGPRGPIYKVKPGVIFLAKKTNVPVIPVVYSSKPNIELKAWDKYQLPLPFARIALFIGEPIYLTTKLDEKTIEDDSQKIEHALNQLRNRADQLIQNH